MHTLLVVGTGYLGTAIARYFTAQKQKVYALTRSVEKAEMLKREGITPVMADLTKPSTLRDLPQAHFVVVSAAPDERDEENYRAIYLEGIRNFLEAFKEASRPFFMIYISSTSVYGDRRGAWVSEADEPSPDTPLSRILYDAEKQFLEAGYPSAVFRVAGIYGPGRNRLQKIRLREHTADSKESYLNLIHRDDIVRAVPVLFKSAAEKSVYLGCDDEPVRPQDYYGWLYTKLGIPLSVREIPEEKVRGKRCKNLKLKSLGFQFQYPTFREGYEALMKQGE